MQVVFTSTGFLVTGEFQRSSVNLCFDFDANVFVSINNCVAKFMAVKNVTPYRTPTWSMFANYSDKMVKDCTSSILGTPVVATNIADVMGKLAKISG